MGLTSKILLVAISILVLSAVAFPPTSAQSSTTSGTNESAVASPPASAQNSTTSGTNNTSIPAAETDASLVGDKVATVNSVSPSTQTVTSKPDQSSFLSLNVTCTGVKGKDDLRMLHVWLCYGAGTVVPGFTEVQVPAPTSSSGQTGTYSVQIEFKYWYAWNPDGGKYEIRAVVDDIYGSSVATYLGAFTYTRTTGVTIDTVGRLFFGTLTYGDISVAQQMTIHNSGNGRIAVAARADDWASSTPWATRLTAGVLQASLTGGGPWQLMTTSSTSVQNLQIPNGPTTSTLLYLQIVVPGEAPDFVLAGNYSTNLVVTVSPV
jgi:hypothetical protein